MGSSAELSDHLAGLGIETRPSAYLPNEFLRLESGMQGLVAQGILGGGLCQASTDI